MLFPSSTSIKVDVESPANAVVTSQSSRLSTRGYNRLFVDLLGALDADPADIPSSVRAALQERTAEFDRWPTDAEFMKSWSDNPLYENLTRPRLRLVLEALEAGLRDKYAETHDVPRNLTVEHVMPQSWEMFWPLPTDKDKIELTLHRNRLLHTIGNLTLLNGNLNPAQSNKAWVGQDDPKDGKREALMDHSVLFLNKQLCDYEEWNEDAISKRSDSLFAIAKATWARPAG